jgi:hypothetical protein
MWDRRRWRGREVSTHIEGVTADDYEVLLPWKLGKPAHKKTVKSSGRTCFADRLRYAHVLDLPQARLSIGTPRVLPEVRRLGFNEKPTARIGAAAHSVAAAAGACNRGTRRWWRGPVF